MHYHLEVIMPLTKDIDDTLNKVMAPYCEHQNGEYIDEGWWDWYEIGGRWSDEKIVRAEDPDKLKAFYKELNKRDVTVSSIMAGKPSLQPADQREKVDALWRKFFPDASKTCPLFSHYEGGIATNVCTVSELSENLSAYRVLIAAPDLIDDFTVVYHEVVENWDGKEYVETGWSGSIAEAIEQAPVKPEPDWLVVTVDYHC